MTPGKKVGWVRTRSEPEPHAGSIPDKRQKSNHIAVDYINQGLATEASAALTKVAFEINRVERVEIHCALDNARSAAVPRKLGFMHEATLRQRVPRPGGRARDVMIWSLLADEYPASPAAGAEIKAYDAAGHPIL